MHLHPTDQRYAWLSCCGLEHCSDVLMLRPPLLLLLQDFLRDLEERLHADPEGFTGSF